MNFVDYSKRYRYQPVGDMLYQYPYHNASEDELFTVLSGPWSNIVTAREIYDLLVEDYGFDIVCVRINTTLLCGKIYAITNSFYILFRNCSDATRCSKMSGIYYEFPFMRKCTPESGVRQNCLRPISNGDEPVIFELL